MPTTPVKVALIGLGRRGTGIYLPLLKHLKDQFRLAAVCDPVKELADKVAAECGVPGFYSVRDVVRARQR